MTFGAHNLVRSEPFLDSRCELCCKRLTNLYKYTSMFSALNYCGGIFWKLSAIYTKWCTQIFPPIFGLFAIFDRNFANVVAPSSEENENFVVHRKARSLLKRWKLHQNRPINRDAILVRTMHLSNEERPGLGAWQTKKQEAQLMLTNPCDALRGQSRSPNIVPFHILGIFHLVQ